MTREDALNFFKEVKDAIEIRRENGLRFHVMTFTDETVEAIDMAIESLSVVRCKDCRYRELDGDVTHFYWCRLHDRPVDDDDFCVWGERKGGAE